MQPSPLAEHNVCTRHRHANIPETLRYADTGYDGDDVNEMGWVEFQHFI